MFARRFGKFTKVLFEPVPAEVGSDGRRQLPRPRILGSYVETYLLEKSRVVFQERGERGGLWPWLLWPRC